jgi:hypothetical protein
MLLLDAEPSRKERGHRGVRPCHPSWSAARRTGAGSSSGPGPRRFAFLGGLSSAQGSAMASTSLVGPEQLKREHLAFAARL